MVRASTDQQDRKQCSQPFILRQEAKDRPSNPDPQIYNRSVSTNSSVKPNLAILSVKGTAMLKDVTMLVYGNLVPTPCTHKHTHTHFLVQQHQASARKDLRIALRGRE